MVRGPKARRWLGGLACLVASAALLVPASAGAKPVLLLFHPGGFCFGGPSMMDAAAAYARPNFQPVEVDYPLCRLAKALKYSTKEAERFPNRTVYAYGESAGGSLAARLGEMGLVKAAAVQDPVADVPKFIRPYRQYWYSGWYGEARWISPNLHPSKGPIRAWIARDDPLAPDSWKWARADSRVAGKAIPGKHLQQPYKGEAMHSAIDYLAGR